MLSAFAVAHFPAWAADHPITAVANTSWDPNSYSIDVNDTVTWTNTTTFSHNVCIRRSNVASGCGEARNGDPAPSWADPYTHQFTSDGTFTFMCQLHPTMTGTITVGTGENPPVDTGTGTGTGTGTSTTPPTGSQPTDTATVPIQQTVATDTTAPALTGKPKRRASRSALIVTLSSSEDATLKAGVFRRPPHGRSFGRVSQRSVAVKQGKDTVTLIRKLGKRRAGAYRVTLQLVDAAGNKSPTTTLNFKIA